MKVLLHKDLIQGFIKHNLDNDEQQSQIRQIIDNKNSKFLYSKKFFSFIKEDLEDEDIDFYQKLFIQFSDNIENKNIKSSLTSQTFDEEFIHIFSSVQDNVVISLTYNQPSQEIQNHIPNIAILSQQLKPNYDWLVLCLAICQPDYTLSVSQIDFTTDGAIDIFFRDIFSIPKKIENITIFDDYYNVNEHKKYDTIKDNNIKVYYCTENHSPKYKCDKKGNFNNEKYTILKKHFPKLR